jgi:hypothetical protein
MKKITQLKNIEKRIMKIKQDLLSVGVTTHPFQRKSVQKEPIV